MGMEALELVAVGNNCCTLSIIAYLDLGEVEKSLGFASINNQQPSVTISMEEFPCYDRRVRKKYVLQKIT